MVLDDAADVAEAIVAAVRAPDLLALIRQIQADCANCMERERALARIILDRTSRIVTPHDPATKADA